MRVFITGGTGLLGSHLADELRVAGHDVVALCRNGADAARLESRGCVVARGDVRDDAPTLARAMAGCSHVVHGAALVYADEGWPTIEAVNVQGTRNVLEAAAAAGVGRVVHISSVAVYGTVDGPIDETASIRTDVPSSDLYARSKREAERVAHDVARERGLGLIVLRPSAVYGEHDRLMAPTIADIVRLPLVPLFGPGDNTLPVVYAGNVSSAIVAALESPVGEGTYNVGLDHPLTQRGLFEGLAAGLGVRPRFVRLPATMVRGAVSLLTAIGVSTPGAKHLPLDRVSRLALGENPYPSRRIREELKWDPPHTHADALARTGAWLRQRTGPSQE